MVQIPQKIIPISAELLHPPPPHTHTHTGKGIFEELLFAVQVVMMVHGYYDGVWVQETAKRAYY